MQVDKVSLNDVYELLTTQLKDGGTVRFKPKGTSMLPTLRQGVDEVVISTLKKKPKKYDILFYRRANGQFVLHRLIKMHKGEYVMRGDHQFEYEYSITDDNIIGVVSEIYRDGRCIKRGSVEFLLWGSLGALYYRCRVRLRNIVKRFSRR